MSLVPDMPQTVSGTISSSVDLQNIIVQFVLQLRCASKWDRDMLTSTNFLTPNVLSILIHYE